MNTLEENIKYTDDLGEGKPFYKKTNMYGHKNKTKTKSVKSYNLITL